MSDSAAPKPMSQRALIWLIVYLGVVFTLSSYVAWTAWSALPAAGPPVALGINADGSDGSFRIDSVSPGALHPGDGVASLTVFGAGFDDGVMALLNGETAALTRRLDPGILYVEVAPAQRRSLGRLAVSVQTGSETSNLAIVEIADPGRVIFVWRILGSEDRRLSQEARFLLLTLLIGVLGGTLSSLNGLAQYRGNGRLFAPWTTYFVVAPVFAGGVALFLYFVVRAGLLSGTDITLEPEALPWGLLAIAALGGLFYDRTFLKLREVFITLFKADDTRPGKLDEADEPPPRDGEAEGEADEPDPPPPIPPVVTTTRLPDARVAEAYEAFVEAPEAGEDVVWSVEPPLPGGLELHPGTGLVSGTPVEPSPRRLYVFTAENLEGGKGSTSLELEVEA